MREEKDTTVEEKKIKTDNPPDELDTTTTFADMNCEGFRWYDPHLKKTGRSGKIKLTRKEYWSMVKGALSAMLPVFIGIAIGFLVMYGVAMLWLI